MPKAGRPANNLEMGKKTKICMHSQYNQTPEEKNRDWRRGIGERAEEVASFYLKLNGFFTLPNFAVHRDYVHKYIHTEADLLAVRFPHSIEEIDKKRLDDDPVIAKIAGSGKRLFLIVEVKAGTCEINETWTSEYGSAEFLLSAIKRMGLASVKLSKEIANSLMGQTKSWENDTDKVVHLCIGKEKNDLFLHPQILFSDMAKFFSSRLVHHPLKIPGKPESLRLWGVFGYKLVLWQQEQFNAPRPLNSELIEDLSRKIRHYILFGS